MCSRPRPSSRWRTFEPVPTGTVLFITITARRSTPLELVDDGPDGGEIGVARVGGRRPDGDVEEVGVLHRLRDVERVRQPLGVAAQQLLEPRLVDRHLAGAEPLDPLGDDVADDDVVPEVGEARTGDEADVAGAEDSHSAHGR